MVFGVSKAGQVLEYTPLCFCAAQHEMGHKLEKINGAAETRVEEVEGIQIPSAVWRREVLWPLLVVLLNLVVLAQALRAEKVAVGLLLRNAGWGS